MKKDVKKILNFKFILLAFLTQVSLAQVNNYWFTQSLSTYGAASTGTLVGTIIQGDDINQVNLPFPFVFNGTTFTNVNVCANGYLSFGSLNMGVYDPISDLTTQNIISAFGQDLFMGTVSLGDLSAGSNTITNCSSTSGYSIGDVISDHSFDFGGINPTITAIFLNNIVVSINSTNTVFGFEIHNFNGYIKQTNSGTSPNQIVEFEFGNFCRSYVYNEIINFKIRLFEYTNVIEVLYGHILADSLITTSEVGLKGNTTSDFNSRKVIPQITWMNSANSALVNDNCVFSNQNRPVQGLKYQWQPICTTPSLLVTSSQSIACSGDFIYLNINGAYSYSWNTGATSSQIMVNPTITTTYSVIGNNHTCSTSVTITQSVVSNPIIQISSNLSKSCKGETVTFTANGATSYTWSNGIIGSTLIVSPSVTTNYSVVGSNGTCTNSAVKNHIVSNCTGLDNLQSEFSWLKVFPNPFSDELYFENTTVQSLKVNITNLIGEVIISLKMEANSKVHIPTHELKIGMYFVQVENSNLRSKEIYIKN